MKYYLGIDGGGTKTVAAVADENGNIVVKKTGRTINFYSVGMGAARANLASLMSELSSVTGVNEYRGVFIGCSALDSRADDELLLRLCGGIITADKIGMDSDVYIALKSAGDEKRPCIAICGTGSMAVARDGNGKIRIAGGWGHILGDEGSGYAIAVQALKRCCVLCDRNETSPLCEKASEFFGKDNFRHIIDTVYSADTTKDVIARFASVVGELSMKGESEAAEIIRYQAKEFAKTVLILLDKTESSFLGLYGGVFEHNEIFKSVFSDAIREKYTEMKIDLINVPPEESALMLAMEL